MYWEDRQKQLNKQLEKDEEKLKIKLSKSYDIQQKKLEKEIASYYQTYGENNVIEYRKLMENLSYEDKQLLLQRMDEFAEKYPQYAHLMPVRESIYKLNRLEGLQTSIKMQQLEIGAIDNAELQSHLEQLAVRSANSSAEQLGFGKNFYTVNSDLVSKTVGKQWADGKNFSERIWDNREKLTDYLNNDFAMAIARGDSYEKCIKALGERFSKVSRNDIYRLIYTEGTFVQNEASITPFEEDFEEYEISIADERACKHCKAMRGKKFSIKDRKAGVNFPPFHSWCRCSFTIAVDDWDKWIDDYVEKHGKEPENSVKAVANSGESGIIKSLDIDDYELITYGKGISDEVNSLIIESIRIQEKKNGFIISEVSAKSIPKTDSGTPVLQIEALSNGLLRLNLNTDVLAGKTIKEIDELFCNTDDIVANSLSEAIIHEAGHAISITGKTANQIKKLYDELSAIHIDGISVLARKDGAECLAELEILRSRNEKVSDEAMKFYEKYMGRKY